MNVKKVDNVKKVESAVSIEQYGQEEQEEAQSIWELHLQQLIQYKNERGHYNVPNNQDYHSSNTNATQLFQLDYEMDYTMGDKVWSSLLR